MRKIVGLILVCFCILTVSNLAFAARRTPAVQPVVEEKVAPVPASNKSYRLQMIEQLGRGAANVLYSPLEIPYRLKDDINRKDPFRGFVPGLIKGASWGIARAGIGVYEMGTFYMPHDKYIEDFDADWLYA
ncbi:MAG: hypothetical protein A3B72_03835 [Omnitrophica bacterium RIFCSPHIGHO2_02_FULL_45_28]|nr:MAG: hypothetical protein A3B72_03835 [Omnitrophica bacterium RIFCSPHIGHO2_02_FULL_45_28]